MKNKNHFAIYIGLSCLIISLLFNEIIIAKLLTSDGNITNTNKRLAIFVIQIIIFCAGLFLLIKRPVYNPTIIRKLVQNISLSIFSLIICLIISEIILRSIFPINSDQGAQYRPPHPQLGWSLTPDISYTRQMFQKNVLISHNSGGWRDIEHSTNRDSSTYRILVLGDSFMEARTVNLEEMFVRQLETLIKNRGQNVEVINMSVGGYGTLQEYLVYELYGRLYKPDLVLLSFTTLNDVRNNSSELNQIGSRPYLDSNLAWNIIPVDYDRIRTDFLRFQTKLKDKKNSVISQLVVLQKINKVFFSPKPKDWKEREIIKLGVSACEETEQYTRAWELTGRILKKLKNRITQDSSKLVVFSTPAITDVVQKYIEKTLELSEAPNHLCLEEAVSNKRLNNILNELDIPFIDLIPHFREANRKHGIQLYPIDDGHWNAAGHSLAAEKILSELTLKELL